MPNWMGCDLNNPQIRVFEIANAGGIAHYTLDKAVSSVQRKNKMEFMKGGKICEKDGSLTGRFRRSYQQTTNM